MESQTISGDLRKPTKLSAALRTLGCFCPKCVDDDLRRIAKFRSRERLPVLVWQCSSPGPPFGGAVSHGWDFGTKGHDGMRRFSKNFAAQRVKLIIYDTRPKINAVASKAAGKGYEDSAYYKKTELLFYEY